MGKRDILRDPVEHIDIKAFDSTPILDGMREMSFTAREIARPADIPNRTLGDQDGTIILCVAGSTGADGCMQIYIDMVRHNMVNAVVATGPTIVDMDFFEASGFRHYRGSPVADDKRLRELYVDRIYDTYIDDEQVVFAEATSVLPLIASHAYHKRLWQNRPQRRWGRIFEPALAGERQ